MTATPLRTRLGFALMIAGGIALSLAGARYAQGAVRADQVRTAWDAAEARRAVVRAQTAGSRGQVVDDATPIAVGSPVAHLLIPRIHLDEIVLEGVGGDELNADPGHYPGSALPGRPGNAVISAHRDRHFTRLGELHLGDTVITDVPGKRVAWVIVGRRIIDKDAPALFRTTDATLTLTTCWPIRYLGSAPDRLILTAHPLRPSVVD